VAGNRQRLPATGTARNVILFVGDGMGISTVTAARIYAGQLTGASGEEHNLSFDKFSRYTGLPRTYNVDAQTRGLGGHHERHDDRRENDISGFLVSMRRVKPRRLRQRRGAGNCCHSCPWPSLRASARV
jgi:hypothetical protein